MNTNKLRLIACIGIGFISQFSIFNSSHAQWWTGWSQKTSLALCLHQADSTYELYSPLQSTEPIAVTKWSLSGDTLRLECASIGLKMTLKRTLTGEGQRGWQGTWRQGLLREPITLLPADTLYQLRRPQTPQHRFTEETLTVDYVDSHGDSIHLEGTLTLPLGHSSTPYPCLMLVSGSGQQNRDEELFLHRPFFVLADYLASRGIATLRYDDRGVGASRGPLDSATTLTFAEDAEALFNILKHHPSVAPRLLGIGGHSEGAAIAPMVAARNKDVKYVVMLAGQGCSGLDVMLQQNEAIFRAQGLSDSLVAIRVVCMREIFEAQVASLQMGRELPARDELQAIILRHTASLTKEQKDSIGFGRGAAYNLKQQLDLPWMQAFLALDPASYLPKVHCPLLALGGSRDCQVLAAPNLQRIKQLCPQAETRLLPDLNHLFQHCTTGAPDEYIQIEETFAPEAMRLITDFLLGPGHIPGNTAIEIR